MPEILILEGLTDATFFQEVLVRFYLHDAHRLYMEAPGRRNMPAGVLGTATGGNELQVDFRYSRQDSEEVEGGKDQITAAIRLLLDGGVHSFAVSQDIDNGTPEQIVQSVSDVARSCLGAASVTLNDDISQIQLPLGNVTVMPMGLFNDALLSELGVTKHELEDYLIKLLLEDENLRKEAPELGTLLARILPDIRKIDGTFNSGKEVFQLIKPIVHIGVSDTGAIRRIIRTGDEDILRSVLAPLLEDLDRALTA